MNKRIAETISVFSFMKMFSNEEDARMEIEKCLWSDGIVCPHCQHNHGSNGWRLSRIKGYRCKFCKKDFTIRIGTIFEGSNLEFRKWLYAMYLVMTSRKGVSSLQLSKEIGTTQKTAWFLLHRIRESSRQVRDLLSGIIEVDETYIGGLEKNKHPHKKTPANQGRSIKTKKAVVGLRSRDGEVRATAMDRVDSQTIQEYIDKNVMSGSVLSTDEARFYRPIQGYEKIMVNHSVSEFVNGMAYTNGIESVWALLKRGYHGTYHPISKKHLGRYVNEFAFRLNQGNCEIDTIDRIKSLIKGASGKRLTYKELISNESLECS